MKRGKSAAAGLMALWLASVAAAADAPAAGVRIQIRDFMFAPMELRTEVGVPVTWVNQDDEPHTVVSDTGLFRSGALDTGKELHLQVRQARNLSRVLFHASADDGHDHCRVRRPKARPVDLGMIAAHPQVARPRVASVVRSAAAAGPSS